MFRLYERGLISYLSIKRQTNLTMHLSAYIGDIRKYRFFVTFPKDLRRSNGVSLFGRARKQGRVCGM